MCFPTSLRHSVLWRGWCDLRNRLSRCALVELPTVAKFKLFGLNPNPGGEPPELNEERPVRLLYRAASSGCDAWAGLKEMGVNPQHAWSEKDATAIYERFNEAFEYDEDEMFTGHSPVEPCGQVALHLWAIVTRGISSA